jgi:hypothetical protein
MPAPNRRSPRRYPDAVRHRLEVATARAWEALVETHTQHALRFIRLLAGRVPLDEALSRYIGEMDLASAMGTAIQARVLATLEAPEYRRTLEQLLAGGEPDLEGWRRFRPDRMVRGVRDRYRKNEEVERLVQLALAQAEEASIQRHIENAAAFAELYEPHATLRRAVEDYIEALELFGGRAQAVFQRTMARLAEIYLPEPALAK